MKAPLPRKGAVFSIFRSIPFVFWYFRFRFRISLYIDKTGRALRPENSI